MHQIFKLSRLMLLVALSFSATLCFAQAFTPSHQSTTSSPGARYEILQSPIAAKWTFRLDRYAGRVWQIVRTKDDDNAWEEMLVAAFIPSAAASRPRFQIFSSGLAARHTFLVDNDSGKTWVLTATKRKRADGVEFELNTWQPFVE